MQIKQTQKPKKIDSDGKTWFYNSVGGPTQKLSFPFDSAPAFFIASKLKKSSGPIFKNGGLDFTSGPSLFDPLRPQNTYPKKQPVFCTKRRVQNGPILHSVPSNPRFIRV